MDKEVDWTIHGVFEDDGKEQDMDDDYIDYHTHGLDKYLDGKELSIYCEISSNAAMYIINNLGLLINYDNFILYDGMVIEKGILCNLDLRIIEAPMIHNPTERSIKTYRIIIPDRYGNYPDNPKCTERFKYQNRLFVVK